MIVSKDRRDSRWRVITRLIHLVTKHFLSLFWLWFHRFITQAKNDCPGVVPTRPIPSSSSDSKHRSNPNVRNRQQSLSLLRRHAEKLKSFNNQSPKEISTSLRTLPAPSITQEQPPPMPSRVQYVSTQNAVDPMLQHGIKNVGAQPMVTFTAASARSNLLSSIKLLQLIE